MSHQFTPETTGLVAGARTNATGDLLRRTALRYPGRTAVIADGRRADFAEFDLAVTRCANALAARGLAKGDRLALLSHNSWQFAVLVFATARLGVVLVPVNFMLGAEEVAFILGHSGAAGMVAENALVPTADRAIALAGLSGGVRGRIGASGAAASGEWEDVDTWIDAGDETPVDVPVADDVEVHALPMYHCAQLDCFFSVDVYLGAASSTRRTARCRPVGWGRSCTAARTRRWATTATRTRRPRRSAAAGSTPGTSGSSTRRAI